MKRIVAAIAAVLLIITGVVMMQPASATMTNGVPVWDHVVIVVMENHSTTQIMGSSNAPYINSLAAQGTNFTDAHGIIHPSEPNYIALFSGSKQGLTDDSCPHTYTSPNNMEQQLEVAGKSFKGYAETMPSAGYTGCSSGAYARRHAPWVNFTSVNQATQSLPFTQFPTDYNQLPTVSMVIPNNNNNMHDGSINTGDAWLQSNLDGYAQWAKTHNSLLIVTFDEDDNTVDNHIPTVMVGANVKVGNSFTPRIDLYDLLTLVQDAYGLPRVNNTVGRPVMTQPWGSGPVSDGTAATAMGWGSVIAGDEFNYVGRPDSTKWSSYDSPGHAGNGVRSPNQLWIDVDHLSIAGTADGTTGGMSAKFANQKYGRWEARIRTGGNEPKYHGVSILWPVATSSRCEELDYFEQNGSLTNANLFLHYACSGTDKQTSANKAIDMTAYHNYAVEWSATGVIGYIDGVEWFRDTNSAHIPTAAMKQTFQLDWFPVAGQATNPSWMDVDWVRVYAAP